MLSYFRWVLFFIVLLVTVIGGALFLGNQMLTAPGPLEKTKTVVIPRGAGPATMTKVLQEEGVIDHAKLFRVALVIDPSPKPIKAGEYEIPAHVSMQALVDLLQSGKVVQRRLTVPEGMTTWEVIELVRKTEALAGDITLDLKEGDLLPETYFYSRDDTRDGLLLRMKEAMDRTMDEAWRKRAAGLPLANRREALAGDITLDLKEGDLLPETYFYSRDDTRDGLLLRMKEAMDRTMDEAWRKRAAGLPLANRREALVLASMIEKETAIAAERPKVASVFINRLRRRMRLESDPTVIYGLTGGKASFNRELSRADLQSNSPYNTYMVAGLPSGPICNPGRAS